MGVKEGETAGSFDFGQKLFHGEEHLKRSGLTQI